MQLSEDLKQTSKSLEELDQLRLAIAKRSAHLSLLPPGTAHEELHAVIQIFRSKCDTTSSRISKIKRVANTAIEVFEANRLSAKLAQEIRSAEKLIAAALQDEELSAVLNSSESSAAGPEATDSLLMALAVVESREELIANREKGISQIRQDVVDLRSLFQEIAFHVNHQGGQLDHIEANLISSTTSSQRANEQLMNASSSQRAPVQRKCFLMVLVTLLLVLALLVNRQFYNGILL